ncbi:hypothetical protein [Spirosoma foliorum]|uniref:Outer membrane protein beta-barrel domain-containing protein n=1 Tax=Spirosoma foliorum TaxID=2710596 RepID=A0A7G5GMT9_9BACT|nr:hypothetical protein [Spirosoma foliorum]QMW00181.1 hypothetical protein H3H32_19320 [Spirosoma foliorum]
MKHISLLLFLVGLSVSALAQEVVIDTNYYAPPPVVRKKVLTEDPDQNPYRNRSARQRQSDHSADYQLKETQTWYVGLEGGFRTDGTVLTNTFDGLISSSSTTKATWSALVGYTYRNAWIIEAGYTYAPVHLNITIANGSKPLIYNYQNSGHGIPLRIKRRIGSASRAANGTGFWLSAGAWLVPNGSINTDNFRLIGYNYRSRTRVADTLRLDNTTTLKSISGIAELGVDYSVRLSSSLEFGTYIRKYWGLGQAVRSDITYTVNGVAQPQSTVTANGTGWGFGIALRYIYGRQQEVKKP